VRFYGAPNPVSTAFCKKCTCADHEPPPRLPYALPCVHLGRPVQREAPARSAGGHVANVPPVVGHVANVPPHDADCARDEFVCVLHGRCTTAPIDQRQPTESRSCSTCADYLARD